MHAPYTTSMMSDLFDFGSLADVGSFVLSYWWVAIVCTVVVLGVAEYVRLRWQVHCDLRRLERCLCLDKKKAIVRRFYTAAGGAEGPASGGDSVAQNTARTNSSSNSNRNRNAVAEGGCEADSTADAVEDANNTTNNTAAKNITPVPSGDFRQATVEASSQGSESSSNSACSRRRRMSCDADTSRRDQNAEDWREARRALNGAKLHRSRQKEEEEEEEPGTR